MAELRWTDVEKHCQDEIERLRGQLESHQPEHATYLIRGEIRAFRRILALPTADQPPNPKTKIQPDAPQFE